MRVILSLFLMLGLAWPVLAQGRDVSAVMAALPSEMAERIAARPDRWQDMALTTIHGHGMDGAVAQADLDRAAALDRAYFRARALQPLIEADLDNDGALTREEAAARGAILGAPGRAGLMMQQAQADANGDGTASAAELRALAEAEAMAATSDAEAMLRGALLALDLDGDARLSVAEVTLIARTLAEAG